MADKSFKDLTGVPTEENADYLDEMAGKDVRFKLLRDVLSRLDGVERFINEFKVVYTISSSVPIEGLRGLDVWVDLPEGVIAEKLNLLALEGCAEAHNFGVSPIRIAIASSVPLNIDSSIALFSVECSHSGSYFGCDATVDKFSINEQDHPEQAVISLSLVR